MSFTTPNAVASVGTPVSPPLAAIWAVDAETKRSESTFLGGFAYIYRRTDTGKLHGEFRIPLPDPALEDGAEPDEMSGKHAYTISQPLHHCTSLVSAEKAFEQLVREHLTKSHPELLASKTAEEQAAEEEARGPDPF